MSGNPKPVLVISRCLGFAACRWNGEIVRDDFVDLLSSHVRFITVCPEMEIGLGVPRDPIHIETGKGGLRLVQPATGRDVTGEMLAFCASFLESLPQVEGFILKARSPSCGIGDVKIFPSGRSEAGAVDKGPGFFGGEVKRRFPLLPTESEGRLKNFRLREHFLVRIFTLARFREAVGRGTVASLVDFHSRHKFLLMSYNQTELKALGRLAANPERKRAAELFEVYGEHLRKALSRPPRYVSNINVLLHSLGYFSDRLTAREKSYFLDALQRYRERKIPLSVPVDIMNSWIIRFEEKYLAEQAFFRPYPEGLAMISDSGKGRDL
ncbi:DUF523 and DUF1722 domain-containing protein [Candidatus Solincola tengchongensis]|uniref:YbgA family protein n=1 Tax=Candidatus Solincola tengchongensis TaxID=2900693 RepID=UPI00257BD967|nr:DUF523 and DUF1722 domain-containing protein [Candidatus Solincola tengchongensis]